MNFEPPETLNIADYFLDRRIEEGRGDRIALRTEAGDLTYSEVRGRAHQIGAILRRSGVRQEERVLVALPDGPDFVSALFGILEIGAVAVMVNPVLEPARLAELFDYTRASCVILDDGAVARFEDALKIAHSQPRFLVCGVSSGPHKTVDLSAIDSFVELEAAVTHRDDPAIWLFSGGTTGRPKAVVQSHLSFVNTTELYAKRALRLGEDDTTLSVPKLFFGYATGSNLFFPFSVGGSAILFREHPTADILFDKIRRFRPTVLVNVPAMVSQMVNHPEANLQDLSCLRFATSAGEALPSSLYKRWKEIFGVELLDGLGTAEMWHIFVSNLPGAVRPGTLGKVIPGFNLQVCDANGREVADGEVGQMWVRGRSRASGYWRDAEQTAEAFRGEWFVGGDLVQRNADGYITFCGRSDDVLKISGKWLVPREVENCLATHPAVAECVVVGIENQDGLTKPVAFVVCREGNAPNAGLDEELKSFVLENLEAYKHPRQVVFLDSFPRTHLGKIDRAKLRGLL